MMERFMKPMKKSSSRSITEILNGYYEGFFEKSSNNLLNFCLSICANWVFQGITVMDRTEKIFKVFFDLLSTIFIFSVASQFINPSLLLLLVSLNISHTINWIFNGHFFVIFLDYSSGVSAEEFQGFINKFQKKTEAEPSILAAAIFGSYAKNTNHAKSDLDIGIIRYPGMINGFRACLFILLMRISAFFHLLPIDFFLADSKEHLTNYWKEKTPIILKDNNRIFSR